MTETTQDFEIMLNAAILKIEEMDHTLSAAVDRIKMLQDHIDRIDRRAVQVDPYMVGIANHIIMKLVSPPVGPFIEKIINDIYDHDSQQAILILLENLLTNHKVYLKMANSTNPE